MHKMWTLMMMMTVMLVGMAHDTMGAQKKNEDHGQWLMTEYDDHGGMSQWHITKMLQDKNGYMWFASWNGLNRYDGYEFATFKSTPGDGTNVASDRIRNIVMGKHDDIFCYIDQEIWRFSTLNHTFSKPSDNDSITYYHLLTNDPEVWPEKDTTICGYHIEKVRQVMDDRQGNKWVMGRYGVKKLVKQKTPFATIEAVPKDIVRALFADNKGRIWIASRNTATVTIVDKQLKLIGYLGSNGRLHSTPQNFAPIYSIMQQRNGNIWLCSKPHGLIMLKETTDGVFDIKTMTKGSRHDIRRGLCINSNDVYDIKEDRHGRLWVGTLGGGINMMVPKGNNYRVYNKDNAYKSYPSAAVNVRKVMIVGDSMLMATTTGGLIAADIRKNNIEFCLHTRQGTRQNSLSCNATMDMVMDSEGRLFVSTESGGINMLVTRNLNNKRYEFKHFTTAQGMGSDVVMAMARSGNQLMVQSLNQLIRLDADKGRADNYGGRFFAMPIRFSDAAPLCLEDRRWMLTLETGVMVMPEDDLDNRTYSPQIAITYIEMPGAQRTFSISHSDTIQLNDEQRDVTIGFAALDFADNSNIKYSTRLTEFGEGEWAPYSHARSVSLVNLTPGTYRLDIRSTNADGLTIDNTKSVYIVVTPTFWETTLAKCIYLMMMIAIIYAVTYTLFYIRTLKRQRKENYDKYMKLVNGGDDNGHDDGQMTQTGMSDEDRQFMKRLTDFVTNNLSNSNASVDDMAAATATSRSSLNRKTKNLLGVTPADFMKEARMKRACQMLMTTTHNINDIAYACGFADAKYFSKCFKASRGMSPSEYRTAEK
ncbi:MAG: helix-turn-helix domain-containing protein [Prevotellaceae bacterium]|nr:helix-turn-helix domain-containing protein [Prevotellaceae bacterium]